MATHTTLTSAKAWSPDLHCYPPLDAIGDALILQLGHHCGNIEGDEPAVRVPYLRDVAEVGFVAEGQPIPEGSGTLDEAVIFTGKIATLGKFSREQLAQPNAAQLVVESMRAAVIAKADRAFVGNVGEPTGLLNVAGIVDGGSIGTNLDTLADAVTAIETDGGTASHIIAAPSAWGDLAKVKTGTGSAQSLLGAGTEQMERRLLGVPVLVSAAMPADTLLVLDSSAVLTVHGQVMLDRSDDAFFSSDVAAIRVMWRCGWGAMRPERIVSLSTAAA